MLLRSESGNVCFGSRAACRYVISVAAASGRLPAIRLEIFNSLPCERQLIIQAAVRPARGRSSQSGHKQTFNFVISIDLKDAGANLSAPSPVFSTFSNILFLREFSKKNIVGFHSVAYRALKSFYELKMTYELSPYRTIPHIRRHKSFLILIEQVLQVLCVLPIRHTHPLKISR